RRVGARGKVSNLDIGVMNFQIAVDSFEIALKRLCMSGKWTVPARIFQSLFHPGDLDLRWSHSRRREVLIHDLPGMACGINPGVSVRTINGAIHDDESRVNGWVRFGHRNKCREFLLRI